jgi:hypothetical protein
MTVADGGPLYRFIEFCRNPKTLWGKLQEGRWDWLGVHPKGQFVLGRPRRPPGLTDSVSVKLTRTGAKEGRHGIKVYEWQGQPSTEPSHSRWVEDPEEARAWFEGAVEQLENPAASPVLARVVLFQNGQVTDERFIARTPPPNYQ